MGGGGGGEALPDESILMNIHGQDLLPIEVRYHRSCYKELLIKTVREVENLDDKC